MEKFQKNDTVVISIEDMADGGEGIGKASGYIFFVKDAVIGDVVEAKITKCKKNYGYARLEKAITPSPFRVEPKCPVHRQCGGCQLQALQYEKQLAYKESKVRANLMRIGGFSAAQVDAAMEPIVGMEEPWRYRNKAQYPVGTDRAGRLMAGFYAGRTHDIIANADCALGAPENGRILEAVLSYMTENRVSAYDETTGKGLLRHVLIRTGFSSGEIQVCLVVNGKKLPAEEALVEKLTGLSFADTENAQSVETSKNADSSGAPGNGGANQENAPQTEQRRITDISINVNREKSNVIMGQEIRSLWGSGRIQDSLRMLAPTAAGGFAATGDKPLTFLLSPLSFYQVNPRQTEKLYGIALEYAGLTGNETVWDLYCGIGTISLFMARRAKQVYGVEAVPQAIADARENASRNGIFNVEFFEGRAEDVLPAFYAQERPVAGAAQMRNPDVIVVDPPRKGCDEKCLETMLRMQPERIVYVSCDSATLARDLKVLCEGGYEWKRGRVVDQFGQTVHCEAVCCLRKQGIMETFA